MFLQSEHQLYYIHVTYLKYLFEIWGKGNSIPE